MELRKIFDYDDYANQQVYKALMDAEKIDDQQILKLFNHMVAAHHIWLGRIGLFEARISIWPALSLAELKGEMERNSEFTRNALNELDLDKMIEYQNSKGVTFSNSVEDILFHIANHSNYHRAQIAMRMRQIGIEPVKTDYIFYKR